MDASGTELSWSAIFEALVRYREDARVSEDEYLALLIDRPNEMNWFAGSGVDFVDQCGEGSLLTHDRDLFIATEDFSWITPCPPPALRLHFMLKKVIDAELRDRGLAPEQLRHDPGVGCFFDFCWDKAELATKLRSSDICPPCLRTIEAHGLDGALLQQVVAIGEETRRHSLTISSYLDRAPTFQAWPFPLAVTRHRITVEAPGLRRMLYLLDHFDSLVRYAVFVASMQEGKQLQLEERPSLGWWVERLAPLKRVPGVKGALRIANEGKVVKLRNELRGHGYVQHDEVYREWGVDLDEVLSKMEDALGDLIHRGELVLFENVDLDGGRYIVRGLRLTGSNLIHAPFERALPGPPTEHGFSTTGEIGLLLDGDDGSLTFESLHPWLRRTRCPECHHDRILVADGGDRYIDVFMGHRVELDA
ncbi:MAG: hypothetical protein CMN31_23185 [Sandaracinus sp.]|nr:hypothetical protein [Myxococcales bacterium]MAT24841.1 hypothetical protein [Sandaracinus sp.]MBJ74195.1 hypothetical protein [Sandaracinus sp.]